MYMDLLFDWQEVTPSSVQPSFIVLSVSTILNDLITLELLEKV